MLYRAKPLFFLCLGFVVAIGIFFVGGHVLAQACPSSVSAVDCLRGGASGLAQGVGLDITSSTPDGRTMLPTLIGRIIGNILSLLSVIFFLLTLYAGFLWMFSRGDESKAAQAADIIKGAIAGLIVVLASYALTNLVFDAIGIGRQAAPTPSSNAVNERLIERCEAAPRAPSQCSNVNCLNFTTQEDCVSPRTVDCCRWQVQ